MSAMEEEILARFRQLDDAGKRRVLNLLRGALDVQLTLAEWLQQAHTFREKLSMKYGEESWFGVQTMLDEVREEASWPR